MGVEEFSKRLKELMELEGVSRRALSAKLNVDRTSIRMWLSGRFYPKYDALIKLAAFFKVRIDGLLGLENLGEEKTQVAEIDEDFTERARGQFIGKVTKYMEEERLSTFALARRLRIDPKSVKNWLAVDSMPETGTMIRLAQTMCVSVEELLGRRI